jgi:hypothetical protein
LQAVAEVLKAPIVDLIARETQARQTGHDSQSGCPCTRLHATVAQTKRLEDVAVSNGGKNRICAFVADGVVIKTELAKERVLLKRWAKQFGPFDGDAVASDTQNEESTL